MNTIAERGHYNGTSAFELAERLSAICELEGLRADINFDNPPKKREVILITSVGYKESRGSLDDYFRREKLVFGNEEQLKKARTLEALLLAESLNDLESEKNEDEIDRLIFSLDCDFADRLIERGFIDPRKIGVYNGVPCDDDADFSELPAVEDYEFAILNSDLEDNIVYNPAGLARFDAFDREIAANIFAAFGQATLDQEVYKNILTLSTYMLTPGLSKMDCFEKESLQGAIKNLLNPPRQDFAS